MHSSRGVVSLVALALVSTAIAHAGQPPDRTPPTKPTIDSDREPNVLRPVFYLTATDRRTRSSRLRYRCALDGAALRPCARIHRPVDALAFGRHEMRALAVDEAGNRSRLATFAFTIVGLWDAAADFAPLTKPENPSRDRYGNATWSYLYSGSAAHDPSDYHVLALYLPEAGLPTWRNTSQPFPLGTWTSRTAPDVLFMQPGTKDENAVLGWRSPVAQAVTVTTSLTERPSSACAGGNGIVWSIDEGAKTLMSAFLPPGGVTGNVKVAATVAAGETLYLVIDANGDGLCDAPALNLQIRSG